MFDHPVTFKEADDAIGNRMDRPTAAKYKDIMATWSAGARQRAFFSSRVMDATVLSELHRTVQKVVSGEMTERQAVRIIRERFAGPDADALAAMGFAPKKDAQGVSQLASIRRIKLVMHTNARMAQECGHFRQWEAVRDMYPYGIWHCGYAEEHRKEHLARDGRLYPFEHPIWRHSPPGGEFNCHCWREPVTADDAMGMRPEPMDSAFEPSSLGFDPSMPMDGEDVQPGKRVLPSLSQKAKAQPCPDDVLADMDDDTHRIYTQEEKDGILSDICEQRKEEFAKDIADTGATFLDKRLPDEELDFIRKKAIACVKNDGYAGFVSIQDAINAKNAEILAENKQKTKNAIKNITENLPSIYTKEAMMYGKPPRITYSHECRKTCLSCDGFELVIGKDILNSPENVMRVIKKLNFVERMKEAREYRKQYARNSIDMANKLGIPVKEITFVNNLETKNMLRDMIPLLNPNFSSGEKKWTRNCQRCIFTLEAQMHGLPVVAKPNINWMNDIYSHGRWSKVAEKANFIDITKGGNVVSKIIKEIGAMPEGSRCVVKVVWNQHEGHVFNAEKRSGRIIFMDAQQSGNFEQMNYRSWMNKAQSYSAQVVRVDNLGYNDEINECCEWRRQ